MSDVAQQARAARRSRGAFAVGAALPEGQLRAWQHATGRTVPAVEPLALTVRVGNCTLRLSTNGDLPRIEWKELTRTRYRARSHWWQPPVKGAAASRRPWTNVIVVPLATPEREAVAA